MRNDIDIDDFKKRLEERLKIIVDGRKANASVELDPVRVGRISRMDAMQQQAMTQAARRILEIEHQRILKALSRMKTGDYGYLHAVRGRNPGWTAPGRTQCPDVCHLRPCG